MPKYTYTVINKRQQKLSGTIDAPNENVARRELNELGFSVVMLNLYSKENAEKQALNLNNTSSENQSNIASFGSEQLNSNQEDDEQYIEPDNVLKFEFIAFDKTGKKVVGSIQGLEIYQVYKRLVTEYQFDVKALYLADLQDEDKEKVIQKGLDELKDRLQEEQMEEELKLQQQELDQIEFEQKQTRLKGQVDFVLKKVNEIIDNYRDELNQATKTKLKYYVDKILRIKNSTNLDYIQKTAEEMLLYLQKEELFLNQEQKLKEKNRLAIEAKSMMMDLSSVNSKAQADVFDLLRKWRYEKITQNKNRNFLDNLINVLISPIIGPESEDQRIIQARKKYKQITKQIRDFVIIYFQAPNKEYKKETLDTIKTFWGQRNILKKELKSIIKTVQQEQAANNQVSSAEIVLQEIYNLFRWILAFYLIYYFATIYLNYKEIDILPFSNFNLIFETAFIKYFFLALFLAVCLLGIKLEFLKSTKLANIPLLAVFLFSNLILVLNF